MNNSQLLTLTCICHIFGVLLFLYGYFPNKNYNSYGYSSLNDLPPEPGATALPTGRFYNRIIGKTVLIVIDALRADFIFDKPYASTMPYLQNLLANKDAFGVVAKTQSPTVTLPRLKAITTGTVPGYIDVVMNFGASQLIEDHILFQAKKYGLKTVFYGDDTWIRLFPNYFIRSEGTTSFFVTDFHQVDDNVTRHLTSELNKQDWDLLILHYLGLDHIGHVVGPRSPLIHTKLTEMDEVIRKMHYTLLKLSANSSIAPVVIICGDHGMNDAGSHGGSSQSETEVPLIFTLPAPNNRELLTNIFQIDLTASLSLLLGLPIPRNNLGKIIPGVLSSLDWRRQLYLTYVNAYEIYQVAQRYASTKLDEGCLEFHKTKEEHRKWLLSNCSQDNACAENATVIIKSYYNVMNKLRDSVTSLSISYDHYTMILSIVLQWLSLFALFISLISKTTIYANFLSKTFLWIFSLILTGLIICSYLNTFGVSFLSELRLESTTTIILSALLMALLIGEIILQQSQLCKTYRLRITNQLAEIVNDGIRSFRSVWFMCAIFFHSISLASSSFVEEEHYTWYYLTTTTILIQVYTICHNFITEWNKFEKGAFSSSLHTNFKQITNLMLVLVMFRVARGWNSTGDHWVSLPDIGYWLNSSHYSNWLIFIISLGIIVMVTVRMENQSLSVKCLLILIGFLLWLYHINSTNLPFFVPLVGLIPITYIARIIFILNLVLLVMGMFEKKRNIKFTRFFHGVDTFWLLTAAILSRAHNIFWIAILSLQEYLLRHNLQFNKFSLETAAVLHLFFGKSSFFQQGNSNNLARIDLVGGYVGLETYQPVVIGILLTCSTYATFMFWLSSLVTHIYKHEPCRLSRNLLRASLIVITTQIFIWSFYTIFAFILRYHLFVWTVFSPKLLFEGAFSAIIIFAIGYFNLMRYL